MLSSPFHNWTKAFTKLFIISYAIFKNFIEYSLSSLRFVWKFKTWNIKNSKASLSKVTLLKIEFGPNLSAVYYASKERNSSVTQWSEIILFLEGVFLCSCIFTNQFLHYYNIVNNIFIFLIKIRMLLHKRFHLIVLCVSMDLMTSTFLCVSYSLCTALKK